MSVTPPIQICRRKVKQKKNRIFFFEKVILSKNPKQTTRERQCIDHGISQFCLRVRQKRSNQRRQKTFYKGRIRERRKRFKKGRIREGRKGRKVALAKTEERYSKYKGNKVLAETKSSTIDSFLILYKSAQIYYSMHFQQTLSTNKFT